MIILKEKCSEKGITEPIFIMDKAGIHRYTGLTSQVDELGLKIEYLPPYSPFLNPIENVFSVWKRKVISAACRNEDELKRKISNVFEELNKSICDGFYRKMLEYIRKCENGELIYE